VPPAATVRPIAVRVATAAKLLDMSTSFIWKMITNGTLESVNVGKSRLVLMRSLDRLLGIDHA
jgi:excisionase family DNA binding protein